MAKLKYENEENKKIDIMDMPVSVVIQRIIHALVATIRNNPKEFDRKSEALKNVYFGELDEKDPQFKDKSSRSLSSAVRHWSTSNPFHYKDGIMFTTSPLDNPSNYLIVSCMDYNANVHIYSVEYLGKGKYRCAKADGEGKIVITSTTSDLTEIEYFPFRFLSNSISSAVSR
jgi:hypothetical protein